MKQIKFSYLLISLGVIFLLSYYSCNDKRGVIINVDNWNKNTYSYLYINNAIKNDSLKLGKDIIPSKFKNRVFYTMKEYLDYSFGYRIKLVEQLKSHIEITDDIKIYESYELGRVTYLVQINNIKSLFFKSHNDKLLLENENRIFETDSLFLDFKDKESACFSDYEGLPQHVYLFNNLDVVSMEIKTYGASLTN